MTELPYPKHWIFALAVGLAELEDLVWHFDSFTAKHDKGFPYLDVPDPYELMSVIDGFLTEDLFQGDIARLWEMRLFIEAHLVSVYRSGQEAAERHWDSIPFQERNALVSMDVKDFRAKAYNEAPETLLPSQKCWFVEGFCKMWQAKLVEHIKQATQQTE